jgi:putative FmdB family regulatory protein
MPLYEYQCESCGHQFEAIQKFSDPLLEQCPKCQGPVRKLQSAPAFQFKGSGWYITDYAKKESGGTKGTEPKTETKSDAGEKKTDTAAAKSEAASPKSES